MPDQSKRGAKRRALLAPKPPAITRNLSTLKRYLAMGARGAGGLFGLTPVTGAIGGGLGETAAQAIEGEMKPWEIASSTALGAVGGKGAQWLMRSLGKPVLAAARGAFLGGAAPHVQSLIEE